MKGFTLVEVVVVITIFSILAALGFLMSMETLQGTLHRSERDVVVSLLHQARSRALANVRQSPWGVCSVASAYVLFSGTVCTTDPAVSETVPAHPKNPATFLSPVIFSALAATTTTGTVTVVEESHTTTITVNAEGAVSW